MRNHYFSRPGLVLGFHGCSQEFAQALVNDPSTAMDPSTKPYDWLGPGRYFWEGNPERGLQWAEERAAEGRFEQAAVVGAVIDLGNCFDLLESRFLEALPDAFAVAEATRGPLPENRNPSGVESEDKVVRLRDNLVVQTALWLLEEQWETRFDSVRSVFPEGEPAYPGAGIRAHNHVQLCIRNPNCIKGFFHVRSWDPEHPAV